MKYLALAAFLGMLAADSSTAVTLDNKAALKKIDGLYRQALATRAELRTVNDIADLRGRHAADDVRDWIVSEADARKIAALRTQAKSKDSATADAAVAELTWSTRNGAERSG